VPTRSPPAIVEHTLRPVADELAWACGPVRHRRILIRMARASAAWCRSTGSIGRGSFIAITEAIAAADANILDLSSRAAGTPAIYVLESR